MILSPPKNQYARFRIRGFLCASCNYTIHLFGPDVIPQDCPKCGAGGVLAEQWDHVITHETKVEDVADE